jgi:hypothetical protein
LRQRHARPGGRGGGEKKQATSVSSGSKTSVVEAARMKRDCTRLMMAPRSGYATGAEDGLFKGGAGSVVA